MTFPTHSVADMRPNITARGPIAEEAKVDRASQQKKILKQLDGDQAGSPQVRATSVLQALKKVAERCDMASTVKEVLEVTPRGEGGKGGGCGHRPGGLGWPNHWPSVSRCCVPPVVQAQARQRRLQQLRAHQRHRLGVGQQMWKNSHR